MIWVKTINPKDDRIIMIDDQELCRMDTIQIAELLAIMIPMLAANYRNPIEIASKEISLTLDWNEAHVFAMDLISTMRWG